jgi:hypothetical protein
MCEGGRCMLVQYAGFDGLLTHNGWLGVRTGSKTSAFDVLDTVREGIGT